MGGILPINGNTEKRIDLFLSDTNLRAQVMKNKWDIIKAAYGYCSDLWAAVQILSTKRNLMERGVVFPYNEFMAHSRFNKDKSKEYAPIEQLDLDYDSLFEFVEKATGVKKEDIPSDADGLSDLIDKLIDSSVIPLSVFYDTERYFGLDRQLSRLERAEKLAGERFDKMVTALAEKQKNHVPISEAELNSIDRASEISSAAREIPKFTELLEIVVGNQRDKIAYEKWFMPFQMPDSTSVTDVTPGVYEVIIHGRFPEYVKSVAKKIGFDIGEGEKEFLLGKAAELKAAMDLYVAGLEGFAANPNLDTLYAAANSKKELNEELKFLKEITDPSGNFFGMMKTVGDLFLNMRDNEKEQLPPQ